MEKRATALLLKFPGTNCDEETARALRLAGFDTEVLPFTLVDEEAVRNVNMVVLPGGFSYGDYVMAGKLAQLEIQRKLGQALRSFRDDGGYLLGICNGFQILMRLGLLPKGSLIANTNGRFICQWTGLENRNSDNPFLRKLPTYFELPVAHAEGRFVAEAGRAEVYLAEGFVTLTYLDDINGSESGIAGMQDETGRVFGLMPHPERFFYKNDHYNRDWTGDPEWGWGYYFLKSIHDHIADLADVPVAG